MTPRSLFVVVLKIMGLFILLDIFKALPTLIETAQFVFNDRSFAGLIFWILSSLGIVVVYYLIVHFLLFRPQTIINKLALDKDFDEESFELNLHRSTAIRIGIIFLGGFLFVESFVPLLINVYTFIKTRSAGDPIDLFAYKRVNYLDLASGATMCLISYYLISNSRYVTNFIEGIRRKKEEPIEESPEE